LGDALEMHHHVAHAERTGAEAGNVAPGLERIGGGFCTIEDLVPIAGGIVEYDQVRHMPLSGERARAAGDLGSRGFDARRDGVEGGSIGNLPAEESDALSAVGVDHQALFAIVHTEGETRSALVDALQPEQLFAIARPVFHLLGANPDIAQRVDAHDAPQPPMRVQKNRSSVSQTRNRGKIQEVSTTAFKTSTVSRSRTPKHSDEHPCNPK